MSIEIAEAVALNRLISICHAAWLIGVLICPTVGQAAETAVASASSDAPDYSKAASWVCRPDKDDVCKHNLDTTVIEANGAMKVERLTPDPQALVDCFYLYGTTSRDPQPLSDMTPGEDEELLFVRLEAGPLGNACRVFAPVYRQSTLAAMAGKVPRGDHNVTYGDVRDAFAYYLANDNHGRGYVLIGHSQGGNLVRELVQKEVDGKLAQKGLLSAIILGADLAVPEGSDVGADFKAVPLCNKGSQIGCAVAYHAYRASMPASFGGMSKTPAPGTTIACVSPSALAHGDGPLKTYLPSQLQVPSAPPQSAWSDGKTVSTTFVSVPGMLSARCVTKGPMAYLEVSVHSNPNDRRVHDIVGDAYANGVLQQSWGLHFVEAGLVLGDLVELIKLEGAAYVKARDTRH